MNQRTNTWLLPALFAIAIVLASLIAAIGLRGNSDPSKSAYKADLTHAASLEKETFGELSYQTVQGHKLRVFTYRATQFDSEQGPILFVMHGTNRNAEDYRDLAAATAERVNALLLVVEFARWAYPSGSDYTLGVTTLDSPDGDALSEGRWSEPDGYIYAEIERLFDLVKDHLGGQQDGYYLFGHSAGAQFVHRLLTFLPNHRVLAAVAANAGWYTLPTSTPTETTTMPYGLSGTPVTNEMRRRLFGNSLTILLGEEDTRSADEDKNVRGTPEALAQGKNRLERGRNYFRVGQKEAKILSTPFSWRLAVVDDARHKANEMLPSAIPFLFSEQQILCEPSAATEGVEIVEVVNDPPDGKRGDLNRDGKRVGIEDEFVIVKNKTDSMVCLSGWTLGDSDEPRRHVFPLGTELKKEESIMIFGGGIPTGEFDHQVQWARSGRLSLSNSGDVIALRNPAGDIVSSTKW